MSRDQATVSRDQATVSRDQAIVSCDQATIISCDRVVSSIYFRSTSLQISL